MRIDQFMLELAKIDIESALDNRFQVNRIGTSHQKLELDEVGLYWSILQYDSRP